MTEPRYIVSFPPEVRIGAEHAQRIQSMLDRPDWKALVIAEGGIVYDPANPPPAWGIKEQLDRIEAKLDELLKPKDRLPDIYGSVRPSMTNAIAGPVTGRGVR